MPILVVFETSAGYALLKVLDEQKFEESQTDSAIYFETSSEAVITTQLVDFENFSSIDEAVDSTMAINDGAIPIPMDLLLRRLSNDENGPIPITLLVSESKLGISIMDKFTSVKCIYGTNVLELFRCIRSQIGPILGSPVQEHLEVMAMLLSRAMGFQKIRVNPNQIDVLLKKAIRSYIDLDCFIKGYIARCKAWYGQHFPELACLVPDDTSYLKLVQFLGNKGNIRFIRMSRLVTPEQEKLIKEAADSSVGMDVFPEFPHVYQLIERIFDDVKQKSELEEYIQLRMTAMAPNVTKLVGSLMAAKLISSAGSLLSLAKCPSATIVLFGSEKKLFSALKSNLPTPKYGILYNAAVVQDASQEDRPKICRMLACKIALAARIDAFGDNNSTESKFGDDYLSKMDARLKRLNEDIQNRLLSNKTKVINDTIDISNGSDMANEKGPSPIEVAVLAKDKSIVTNNTNNISIKTSQCNNNRQKGQTLRKRQPIRNKRSYEQFVRSQSSITIECNQNVITRDVYSQNQLRSNTVNIPYNPSLDPVPRHRNNTMQCSAISATQIDRIPRQWSSNIPPMDPSTGQPLGKVSRNPRPKLKCKPALRAKLLGRGQCDSLPRYPVVQRVVARRRPAPNRSKANITPSVTPGPAFTASYRDFFDFERGSFNEIEHLPQFQNFGNTLSRSSAELNPMRAQGPYNFIGRHSPIPNFIQRQFPPMNFVQTQLSQPNFLQERFSPTNSTFPFNIDAQPFNFSDEPNFNNTAFFLQQQQHPHFNNYHSFEEPPVKRYRFDEP